MMKDLKAGKSTNVEIVGKSRNRKTDSIR